MYTRLFGKCCWDGQHCVPELLAKIKIATFMLPSQAHLSEMTDIRSAKDIIQITEGDERGMSNLAP